MTTSYILLAIDIIGAFLTLGFIFYVISVDQKGSVNERRHFSRLVRLWQRQDAQPSRG
jgi:hypothetical protein